MDLQLAGAWRCQAGEEVARDDLSPCASPRQRWECLPCAFDLQRGRGLDPAVNLGSHLRILFKKLPCGLPWCRGGGKLTTTTQANRKTISMPDSDGQLNQSWFNPGMVDFAAV